MFLPLALAAAASLQDPTATEVAEVVVTAPQYVSTAGRSATKSEALLVETPQSISVISRDQIDLLGWTSLMQAVRYTSGITSENYGPDERYDWLTLRGFNPVQYVDGLQAAAGSVVNLGTDLYGFESVEVLKGPSSGLYGQTPPGGLVNLTSRRPQRVFGGELGVMVGNQAQRQVAGDVTGPLTAQVSARLTALVRDRETQLDGVESERTYIAPALTATLGARTELTLLGYWQDDLVTGDGGGFLPAQGVVLPNPLGRVPTGTNLGEPDFSRFDREQSAFGYDLRHSLSAGWSLQQNLKVFTLESFQSGPYGTGLLDADFDGVPDDYRTVTRSQFAYLEDADILAVDTRLAGRVMTGALRHDLTIGLDYRDTDSRQASFFGAAPSIDLFNPQYGATIVEGPLFTFLDQTQTQTGLYVQDQIRTGGWVATVGLRQDWLEIEDRLGAGDRDLDQLTGRAGLNYVFASGVAPYVAYSTSFQPVAGADFDGNLFDPSEGEQWEAGIKYDGRNLAPGIDLFASAAVYALTQTNVLTPDPTPGRPFFSVQTGEVEVRGLELEATARIDERISLNASYAFTDSEVTRSNGADLGKQLTVTPEHKASLFADYTFQTGALAGLGAGLGVRYMGESFGDGANQWRTPGSTLWDAVIHYDLADWRVQATASNLFDQTYLSRCTSSVQCFYGSRGLYAVSLTRRF
ncbi:MAG TPA: TonB-dependent siderophore receptor [Brevundimonas sp.]|jgi:iron complex outermembrane receptor protein|uniref:TonB-dependent siderophore receptor n=1 Tax=Brevundimonas sp. TaxID=1871086 RepID=UPI002E0E24F2|nr:TonB-dependent siderophore receptor [Brevundimonas sp.]